jgi:hypothetical protein
MVSCPRNRQLARLVKDSGVEDSDDESDGTFWDSLRFIAAVFEPCYKLMRKTDSATPIMGKFYHLMSELGGALEDIFAEGKPWSKDPWVDHKEEIVEAHTQRWVYMHTPYHSAGFALDPNFLTLDVNAMNGGEVFSGLTAVIEKVLYDDEDAQAQALQQYADFRKQRGAIFDRKSLQAAAKTVPAHEWWEMIAGGAAELRTVAMRVLSKTSSASACERNWSAFAAVQAPKRCRLSSENLDNLVYLRSNLRLKQKRLDAKYAEQVAQWVEMDALDDDTVQHLADHLGVEPSVSAPQEVIEVVSEE